MGLYFVGTQDLASIDMSELGPRDHVVVFNNGPAT